MLRRAEFFGARAVVLLVIVEVAAFVGEDLTQGEGNQPGCACASQDPIAYLESNNLPLHKRFLAQIEGGFDGFTELSGSSGAGDTQGGSSAVGFYEPGARPKIKDPIEYLLRILAPGPVVCEQSRRTREARGLYARPSTGFVHAERRGVRVRTGEHQTSPGEGALKAAVLPFPAVQGDEVQGVSGDLLQRGSCIQGLAFQDPATGGIDLYPVDLKGLGSLLIVVQVAESRHHGLSRA